MCDGTAVYGDAPEGEFRAVLVNVDEDRQFSRGKRLIFGFLILKEDADEPMPGPGAQPYFAVATCNASKGDSPKSKPFKVRRCLTSADEVDPIRAAVAAPGFDKLLGKTPAGADRIVRVRVVRRTTSKGGFVSEITHIQRLRDGEWEDIRGEFEGPPRPWLHNDGRRKTLSTQEEAALSQEDRLLYMAWDARQPNECDWLSSERAFVPLSADQEAALLVTQRAAYQAAKIRAAKGWVIL